MTVKNQWSSNLLFLITAIGTEAGIANFWKFTYLAGQNGGGTFVFLYFAALIVLAIPALIAEMLIGRRGSASVVGCMRALVERDGISPVWKVFGPVALACIFLILSYYFVICGWMLTYFVLGLSGAFRQITSAGAASLSNRIMAAPLLMLASSGAFILLTVIVVTRGINRGIERVSSILTPARFIILVGLCVYAALAGDTAAAARFLLSFRAERLSPAIILLAVGQAFFSLGIGSGVLMTVGAYMKREYSIVRSVITVALAQGGVALLAGFAIFPLVFAYHLDPTQGPALVFITLPAVFGQMSYGSFFGTLMFMLLSFAGLTATIVLLETIVAFLEEYTRLTRRVAASLAGFAIWVAGIATVYSFNVWKGFYPLGKFGAHWRRTPFELVDYLASNILMPIGGILLTAIAGWALSRRVVAAELGIGDGVAFQIWYFTIRYIVPVALLALFVTLQR